MIKVRGVNSAVCLSDDVSDVCRDITAGSEEVHRALTRGEVRPAVMAVLYAHGAATGSACTNSSSSSSSSAVTVAQ